MFESSEVALLHGEDFYLRIATRAFSSSLKFQFVAYPTVLSVGVIYKTKTSRDLKTFYFFN